MYVQSGPNVNMNTLGHTPHNIVVADRIHLPCPSSMLPLLSARPLPFSDHNYSQISVTIKEMSALIFLIVQLFFLAGMAQAQHGPVYTGTGVNGLMEKEVGNDVVVLGGLVNIHRFGGDSCASIYDSSVQIVEAMALTVHTINSNASFLPGVTLQFEIRDVCSNVNVALEQSLHFVCVRDSTTSHNGTVLGISGVLDAAFSGQSTAVARMLRLFDVPQISVASTADLLSDKSTFDYFLRTIPPDSLQARAIVDIIDHFNWTYVIVIHTGDVYGRDGAKAISIELANLWDNSSTTCIATLHSIELQTNAKAEEYNRAVEMINQEWIQNATVVVLFGQTETAIGMLTAVRRKQATDAKFASKNFTWIGSDGWGNRVPEDLRDIAYGSLSVFPTSTRSEFFDGYFQSLHPNNYTANPWFREHWENFFNCTLRNKTGFDRCETENQKNSRESGYEQSGFVPFTFDAVNAFAHAIRNLQQDFCRGGPGLCEEIVDSRTDRKAIRGDLLLKYLYEVSFPGKSTEIVNFDENGDPRSGYLVHNLQRTSGGRFVYQIVGHWDEAPLNRNSHLDIFEDIQWSHKVSSIPVSICSEPCGNGAYPEPLPDQAECCWVCRPCPGDNAVSTGLTCVECSLGETPNDLKTECVEIQPTYLRWSDWWSILVIILTILGIIATTAVSVVFVIHYKHKLIKASSRELTAILLTGLMLCYLLPFFFIAKPSPWTCGIRRFGVGFCFSLCYSALLVKTNRIHRIFNRSSDSVQVPPMISPMSQVFFTGLLVAVQVVIASVWLAAEVPSVTYVYNRFSTELKCGESSYIGLSITLSYNFLLLVVTTYFAFRTRKVPQNFNEAKFISFTMYTLCVLWLAFIPTYFATTSVLGTVYETGSLMLAIILNATITLCILFLPKVYGLFFTKSDSPNSKTLGTANRTRRLSSAKDQPVLSASNIQDFTTIASESELDKGKQDEN